MSDPIAGSRSDGAVALSPGCTLELGAAGGLGKRQIPGPLSNASGFIKHQLFKFCRYIR